MQLAIRDINQGPFLTQVLRFGRESEHLSDQQLGQIKGKAVLMSLKFADKYYNKYKMHLLEQAAHDVIGVVSLGLQELSARDPAKALARLFAYQADFAVLGRPVQDEALRNALESLVQNFLTRRKSKEGA